ncbi:hypothetical protein GCM10022247_35300 [Allokutzneria multivorans]|uniref:SUKH-4 immunity protein of toxin-antitoxin system n=1 Tax=Allokutzneria multivorans TaxID=1142134 RepID=A0ABP7SCS5_9PSEU
MEARLPWERRRDDNYDEVMVLGTEVDLIAKIRLLWQGKLCPFRVEALHPALSEQDRDFLVNVGLPQYEDVEYFCDGPAPDLLHEHGRTLVEIGLFEPPSVSLVVDAAEGSVFSIARWAPERLTFRNSSLPLYVYIEGRLEQLYTMLPNLPREQQDQAIEQTMRDFAELDPPSMLNNATSLAHSLHELLWE